MKYSVLEYLEQSAKKVPNKPVFVDEANSITYQNLLNYSQSIGTSIALSFNNIVRNPIVVFVDRNIESLVSFLGVASSGNFYVPIDIQMPKGRIELILKTLNPIASVVLKKDIDFVSSVAPGLFQVLYEEAILTPKSNEVLTNIRSKIIDRDPIYATFTSGSTGIPKGVITCHQSVIDMTDNLVNIFGFKEENIFGNQNPFYFDASIKDIYCTLSCGATMHILPKSHFLFQGKLVDYLIEEKIDTILWSAAAIALLSNSQAFEDRKPTQLKHVMFSGEVMHNKVLNYWRKNLPATKFVNLYGPTEITSVCTYYKIEKVFQDDEVLPIGIPFPNTEILLLNEQNQLITQPGEQGELCVKGCCLALGYYNNPEKTEEAFCQNPLNPFFPERIYRTGDLARYNEHGEIMFQSRKDNQVKHMGQRVELGEIEILVNSLEKIEASFCFYDHEEKKIVLVFQGLQADKKYIISELKDKISKFMYPNTFIKLDDMPYNLNGKIDRTEIKKWYNEGELRNRVV